MIKLTNQLYIVYDADDFISLWKKVLEPYVKSGEIIPEFSKSMIDLSYKDGGSRDYIIIPVTSYPALVTVEYKERHHHNGDGSTIGSTQPILDGNMVLINPEQKAALESVAINTKY